MFTADFVLQNFPTAQEALTGGEVGIRIEDDAQIVTSEPSIASASHSLNYLTINGTIIAGDAADSTIGAVEAAERGIDVSIGPTGMASSRRSAACDVDAEYFQLRNLGLIT